MQRGFIIFPVSKSIQGYPMAVKKSELFSSLWKSCDELRGGGPHQGHARVAIRDSTTIDLQVKEGADTDYRRRLLSGWFRQQLKSQIPAQIEKKEPIMGVSVADWGVKKMKTKWGTCSIKAAASG